MALKDIRKTRAVESELLVLTLLHYEQMYIYFQVESVRIGYFSVIWLWIYIYGHLSSR